MRTAILAAVAALVMGLIGACQADDCAKHKAMALTTIQHPIDPTHPGQPSKPGGGHALPFLIGWMAGECKK